MPVGKRIYLRRSMPDPDIVEGFRGLPASNVADVMNRNCAMNPRIRLLSIPNPEISVGVAFTVKARAGDNLVIHAAMQYIGEGDYLVISNEGDTTRSLLGDIMLNYLFHLRKIAGIVVDGPIRDLGSVKTWNFPIYATGSCPVGPYKEGPGEVNVPIACGEVSVHPGDIILADVDGVIVIPRVDAPVILTEARAYYAKDQAKVTLAKEGKLDRAWVEEALVKKEFEIIDDKYDC
ncbi:MAG: RraA family protein [Synergistaceae bacterium]|jgi:regulator of RNase E activity RraA|nr:RraA family protein [Synergistaceae bacterium]